MTTDGLHIGILDGLHCTLDWYLVSVVVHPICSICVVSVGRPYQLSRTRARTGATVTAGICDPGIGLPRMARWTTTQSADGCTLDWYHADRLVTTGDPIE